MKEQKIMTFSQKGYKLNLLKITETSVNGYYLIRENRRIKGTFTTLDAAVKKFYALQGNKILQKELFKEDEITINPNKVIRISEKSKAEFIIESDVYEKLSRMPGMKKLNENYYHRDTDNNGQWVWK